MGPGSEGMNVSPHGSQTTPQLNSGQFLAPSPMKRSFPFPPSPAATAPSASPVVFGTMSNGLEQSAHASVSQLFSPGASCVLSPWPP